MHPDFRKAHLEISAVSLTCTPSKTKGCSAEAVVRKTKKPGLSQRMDLEYCDSRRHFNQTLTNSCWTEGTANQHRHPAVTGAFRSGPVKVFMFTAQSHDAMPVAGTLLSYTKQPMTKRLLTTDHSNPGDSTQLAHSICMASYAPNWHSRGHQSMDMVGFAAHAMYKTLIGMYKTPITSYLAA
jgi:hypothetical protein